MNRIIFLSIFLLSISYITSAQTKWEAREDSLFAIWGAEEKQNPNNYDSYLKFKRESGHLGSLKVWFKQKRNIDDSLQALLKIYNKRKLTLVISENYDSQKKTKTNLTVYLLNFSDKSLSIPRIDATLDSISEFIKVKNQWLQIRKNSRSSCGNSYYIQEMLPHECNIFELDYLNEDLGTETVQYKLVLNYYGNKVYSNEIKIKIFSNQLNRFLEEGINKY